MQCKQPENNETSARLVDGAEAAFAEQIVVGEVSRRGRQLGEVVERELRAALLDPPQLQRLLRLGAVSRMRLRRQPRLSWIIARAQVSRSLIN
jgi:hypothetical protein